MLYRKVNCSKRLPKSPGPYLTDHGRLYFDTDKQAFLDVLVKPQYFDCWYEEIKLPDEEEINKTAKENIPSPEFGEADRLFWRDGFKKCLELLTK